MSVVIGINECGDRYTLVTAKMALYFAEEKWIAECWSERFTNGSS